MVLHWDGDGCRASGSKDLDSATIGVNSDQIVAMVASIFSVLTPAGDARQASKTDTETAQDNAGDAINTVSLNAMDEKHFRVLLTFAYQFLAW